MIPNLLKNLVVKIEKKEIESADLISELRAISNLWDDKLKRIEGVHAVLLGINQGNYSQQLVYSPLKDEVDALALSVNYVSEQLQEIFTDLQDKNEKLVQAQKISKLGYWDLDIKSNIMYRSPQYCEILEISDPEAGLDFSRMYEEDIVKLNNSIEELKKREGEFMAEIRYSLDNGVKYLSFIGRSIVNFDGEVVRIQGTVQDITEMVKIQQKLRKNEERWALAVKGAQDGIWDWDILTGEVYYSPRWEKMFGYEVGEVKSDLEIMNTIVHPDDLQEMYDKVNRYLSGLGGEHYDHEFRMYTKDGTLLWTRHRATAIFDANKMAVRMIGVTADITQSKLYQKQIEDALHEKEILLQEIHHRVKNNLQVITSLLGLQSAVVNDVKTKNAFSYCQYRIQSMALVHEMLYQSSDVGKIQYRKYLQELSESLILSVVGSTEKVKLKLEVENFFFNIDTAIPLGLIINEIITNSLKYAITNEKPCLISIELKRRDVNRYMLVIGDNGPGTSNDVNLFKSKTLGVKLIRQLVRQLLGEMCVNNSTSGLQYQIEFTEIGS